MFSGNKNIDQVCSPLFCIVQVIIIIISEVILVYHLFQVNQIRDSLAIMGDNSTAFSLPQVRHLCVFLHIFQPFFQKKIQSVETLIKMAIFVHEHLWLSLNVFAESCTNTKLCLCGCYL